MALRVIPKLIFRLQPLSADLSGFINVNGVLDSQKSFSDERDKGNYAALLTAVTEYVATETICFSNRTYPKFNFQGDFSTDLQRATMFSVILAQNYSILLNQLREGKKQVKKLDSHLDYFSPWKSF